MDKQDFISTYSPQNGYRYALNEKQCHGGNAPSLRDAANIYGIDVVVQMVDNSVTDFVQFCQSSISERVREQLALVIATQFRYMRVTELLLFFVRAKAGHFGKFYRNIEALDITVQLTAWEAECKRLRNECYAEAYAKYIQGQREGTISDDALFSAALKSYDKDGELQLIFPK